MKAMVKCQFCQATHVANTIFCSECGHYLLENDKRETDPLEVDGLGWVGEIANFHGRGAAVGQEVKRLALRLKIGGRQLEVEVGYDRVIHIGRVDPSSNVFPEIDLTEDDVLEKSVSRRHARILRQDDRIMVEDLGSVNGTFINGKRLAPYLSTSLKDGDILQFGKLQVEVAIRQMG